MKTHLQNTDKKMKYIYRNNVQISRRSLYLNLLYLIQLINMQMKLNFDQLFNLPTSQSKHNFKNKVQLSQASTSLGFQQLNKKKSLRQVQSEVQIQSARDDFSIKTKTNHAMRILKTNQQSGQKYNWYMTAKHDQSQQKLQNNKQINKKQKEFNKIEEKQLINRLYNNDICSKDCCKKGKQEQFMKKIDKSIKQMNLPFTHKRTLTESSKNHNHSQLYQRLYLDYKGRQFRNLELSLQYESKKQSRNKMKLYQNPEYSQNYIKFYDRLESEIQRKNKKQQFYQNYIIDGGKIIQFTPNIRASQSSLHLTTKRPTFIPKKQINQIKGKAQMNEIRKLNNSLDVLHRSFQSSLNKTIEIVQTKQQQFLTKIIRLFEQDGYFKINPQKIQLLKQVQFQILFPLINKMQKDQNVPIEVFEAKLYKFFQTLPNISKIFLRNNQKSRLKNKIKIRPALTINTPNLLKESFKSKTNKIKSKNGDYLKKIQNFV